MTTSGDLVKAEYDYDAKDDDELSFKEGDIITIVRMESDSWCSGRLRGKTGLFPINFVKKHERAPAPPPPTKPPKGRVNSPGFGNIFADAKGNTLMQKVIETKEKRDKEDKLVPSPVVPSRPARDKPQKKKLCKCIYKYEAQREDELDLSEGDVVTVLDENAMEGWWRGSLHGKQGLFPNNFVKELDESASENNASEPNSAQTPVATLTKDADIINLDDINQTPMLPNLTRNRPPKVKSTPPTRGSLHDDVSNDIFDELKIEPDHSQPVMNPEKISDTPVSNTNGKSFEKLKKENDEESKPGLPPWSKYMKKPKKPSVSDASSIDEKSKSQTLPIKKAKPNLPNPNYSLPQPVKEPILAKTTSNTFADSDKKTNQEDIGTLKDEIKSLRDEMEKMRKSFELTVNGLKKEIDEQKKMTVAMRVDVERIREKLYPC